MIEVKPFEKNRYTQTHNIVYDYMMRRLSGNSFKVLSLIIRLTSGWHKDYDVVSYSQIVEYTGIKSNTTISKSIKELLTLGYIVRIPDRETEMGTYMYKYGLNHNLVVMVDDSEPSSENDTSSEYVPSPNNELGTSPNNEQVPSSNNEYTKEREKEEINNTPQQNFNVSDNLNLEPLPDDSSLLPTSDGDIDYEIDNQLPQKQHVTTEVTPHVVDDFSDWEPTAEERKPRERRTAADVQRETAASMTKYIERGDSEPWREWFPDVIRPHGGVSKERLQWIGWRICQYSGQTPSKREVKGWIAGLAAFYNETKGNPGFIDQCITTGLKRDDPQYRPTHPMGYTKIAVKQNAANKPRLGQGGVVNVDYYGPGGAVEVPPEIYEASLTQYLKGVQHVE